MKRTDFIKQINRENRKYEIVKFGSYLRLKTSFGKRRKECKFSYSIFEEYHPYDKHENALYDPYYFEPTDIIIYDLIPKEELKRTKKGIIKLFKNCYSHKFLGGNRSEKDIDNLIDNLDNTLHSGNSWYKIGYFDFAYDKDMEDYVHCFEISFHNFSSSYAAVEMRIILSERFKEDLSGFIKASYKKPGMCLHRFWMKNKKKSGAAVNYGVSSGTQNEYAKSQLIYEQLNYVKHLFLKEIVRYVPLLQYTKNKDIYGINVFETNITPIDKLEDSVYAALGMNEMYGFFFSQAERLYVSTSTIRSRIINEYKSDMMYIYNPNLLGNYEMYRTAHNKAIVNLTMDYMEELYKVVILKDVGIKYLDLISRYRNRVNQSKTTPVSQKRLLKLKYDLSRGFYDFKKIDEELPVTGELLKDKKILENNEYSKRSVYLSWHPYELFTSQPDFIWKQIRENYNEVESDLNRKIEICSRLNDYSSEIHNKVLLLIQVILALATFVLLIFPDKAVRLAEIIRSLLEFCI